MFLQRKSVQISLRVALTVACCFGVWNSLQLARADYLFREDTDESIRKAIRLVPDNWQYYMRLAQFERGNARELLKSSLERNPFDAQADIELGLQYEADGDFGRAEKQLLEAYNVDHTYLPRWSLANYYFRHENMPQFWAWARSAAAMPADDIGALLELCWRVSPNPGTITGSILNEKPEFLRQYIIFLIAKKQPLAIANIAPNLMRAGNPKSDLPLLLSVVNRLILANEADLADSLWRLLVNHGWTAADSTVPNNVGFSRVPVPVGFDWSIPEYTGLHSWLGPTGLETEFTGSQPENCMLAEQSVVLPPGNYKLAYDYRTNNIPPATGIRWQILDMQSQTAIADSPDLSSSEDKQSELSFSVPPGMPIALLRLAYNRSLGTVRVSGTVWIHSVRIKNLDGSDVSKQF
jgi:hypothetical protein